MSQAPADHFSAVAAGYASFRPAYPVALFAWLAAAAPGRSLAWDCAAGSGQASCQLAEHFAQVVATDASPAQIGAARRHPRIRYRVAAAGDSGLPDHAVDLVTVAQALHWLDLEPFYQEVRRVLRPGGLLAVWTYGPVRLEDSGLDALVQAFSRQTVGPYWPPERRHVEDGYRSLPFPFARLPVPAFPMTASWTLSELLGYLGSWSATARFQAARGTVPVAELAGQLAPLWGDPQACRQVTWPLTVLVGLT
ncbi:MAG: class I SAM-dependent methyltransferase [Thermodesulfobacteriota bacterium]